MRDSRGRRFAGCAALSAWLVLLVLPLAGCQHIGPPPCSGEIADLAAAGRRSLHVRLELTREGSPRRYEVAVQVEPGRITAIGLTPAGTHAFRLSRDEDGIEVENRVGRYLGYQPRRAYDAIAHAFLARRPAPGDPPVSAVVTTGPDGVRVANDRCGYSARLVLVSDERV